MITGPTALRDAYRDDAVAHEYVARRFRTPLGALLHSRQSMALKRLIALHRFERGLEIAPGPARLTVTIAPLLAKVTLIDTSVQMLREARRRLQDACPAAECRFIQADAFRLPLRGQIDFVFSFRLIRHFERADRVGLYTQIASILAPGGMLVFDAVNRRVSAPLRAAAKPQEYQHYDALLRPEEIRDEVSEAGFDLVALDGVQYGQQWLTKLQVYVAPRSATLARAAMEVVDRYGRGEPLEWIVTCRRR